MSTLQESEDLRLLGNVLPQIGTQPNYAYNPKQAQQVVSPRSKQFVSGT